MRERRVAVTSFVATAVSVVVVHRWNSATSSPSGSWLDSAVFAVVLLAILGAHELGHHLVARRHGMTVSWPLFLPAPFFVGTLGALLRVHDRPRTRTALLEMGAAGPLAGFVVLATALCVRIAMGTPEIGGDVLGRPLLWWLIAGMAPGPTPLLTTADPVCYAVWVGCLVTAMNLLPFGQLDGGHVATALSPRSARYVGIGVAVLLGGLGFAWAGWWAWLVAIHLLATRRPMSVQTSGPLPSHRAQGAALAAAVVWGACFSPAPW